MYAVFYVVWMVWIILNGAEGVSQAVSHRVVSEKTDSIDQRAALKVSQGLSGEALTQVEKQKLRIPQWRIVSKGGDSRRWYL